MYRSKVLVLVESTPLVRTIRRALFAAGCETKRIPMDVDALGPELDEGYDIYIVDGDAPSERVDPVLELLRARVDPARLLLLSQHLDERIGKQIVEGAADNTLAKGGSYAVVREGVDEAELIATCRKILTGRIFGIRRCLRHGMVPIHKERIGRAQERHAALETLQDYLDNLDLPRSLRSSILTVADELIMNAIFNAPARDDGTPKYRDRPRSEDIQLETDEEVELRFCCDGQYLYLSVEDPFGTLDRDTIVRYIGSGLMRRRGQMEEKEQGAGLGLFMVFSSINQLVFNVQRKKRSEIIAGFYVRDGLRGFREAGQSLNFFFTG